MRAATVIIGVVVVAAILYCIYYYRAELGIVKQQTYPAGSARSRVATETPPGSGSPITGWSIVDRPAAGFSVEMPSEISETRIPAITGNGTIDPVETIEASPGPETTLAISWAENPPVAQAGGANAELTLDMARDGALARTHTMLTGESRSHSRDHEVSNFAARNHAGGILSARLILTGSRLYMLTATFPDSSAGHADDVNRFFNSFRLITVAPAN
jgi:hypothetical protein